MIRFFRRALSSWLVLGLFGLIMVAFIVTGVGTPGGLDQVTSGSADAIARVGNEKIGTAEVAQRVQLAQQNLAQTQPGLTLPAFVAQGGADEMVRQLISARTLDAWSNKNGVVAGKRLVDGEIASITAFRGPTGSFDEATFRAALAQRRITEAQLRRDIASDLIRRQLLLPVGGAFRAPSGVAMPYAELMLEARKGEIASIPAALLQDGPAPTDAELKAYYTRNIARYTLPERRVLRYALVDSSMVKVPTAATEAEIAAAYKADAANYGATETRSFSQVILPSEAAAKAFAAKVKGGTAFADAAKAAGFTPADTAIGVQSKTQLASLAGPALANAAFSATAGTTLSPAKSALGWHVIRVDTVKQTAGVPLAAARAEIAARIGKQKADAALADLVGAIEDEIADGASFDEVVKARGLKAVATPAATITGQVPGSPVPLTDPVAAKLLRTAFDMSADDDPTVESLGEGQPHALLKVGQVIAAAPQPLAQLRARVTAEFAADRALARAKAIATAIKARTDKGQSLAAAIAAAGVKLPAPQPAAARKLDLARAGQAAPAPLAALFGMKKGSTKLVAAPGGQGWFVVRLDSIEKGSIASAPELVTATRGELDNQIAQELAEQFTGAAAQAVGGVKRNDALFAQLKAQLSGAGGQ